VHDPLVAGIEKPYETVPAEGPGTLHLRRTLDRLPGPVDAAVRVIDCANLSERVGHLAADDDLIHNGVWERASDSDREETGPCEHWDYYAIWDAWNYSCHQFLASYGATWDPDPHGGEGTLTVPADKDDEWADRLWQAAIDRFDGWIGNVVSETRKGRHLAPADGVRPRSAPGAEWVRYVTPETDEWQGPGLSG
jgi:hypothetical protein